jgi:hypothetical protein
VMSDNTIATYILNPETKLNEHTLPERKAIKTGSGVKGPA